MLIENLLPIIVYYFGILRDDWDMIDWTQRYRSNVH